MIWRGFCLVYGVCETYWLFPCLNKLICTHITQCRFITKVDLCQFWYDYGVYMIFEKKNLFIPFIEVGSKLLCALNTLSDVFFCWGNMLYENRVSFLFQYKSCCRPKHGLLSPYHLPSGGADVVRLGLNIVCTDVCVQHKCGFWVICDSIKVVK